MLQKAYEQAKKLVVTKDLHPGLTKMPIEVKEAFFKIRFALNEVEFKKLLNGTLTVKDLDRFQAPSCTIK